MNRLLIIGHDAAITRTVADAATTGGDFVVSIAGSLAEAITHGTLETLAVDAIIVADAPALAHPETTCGRLRQIWSHAPVLLFTGTASEHDIVRGLDAGASDFLTGPCRHAELQARLRAQIRAHANSAAQAFQIGPYRFDPEKRVLRHVTTKAAIRLTYKEAEMLKFLRRAEGEPVPRQILLRDLWGYKDGADSYTVESHIYRLRRKLEADPSRPRFLVNEAGGYLLLTAPPRPWPPTQTDRPMRLAG